MERKMHSALYNVGLRYIIVKIFSLQRYCIYQHHTVDEIKRIIIFKDNLETRAKAEKCVRDFLPCLITTNKLYNLNNQSQ